MKVLLSWFVTEEELQRAKRGLPEGTVIVSPKPRPVLSPYEVIYSDVADLAANADVILSRTMPPGVLEKTRNLKALCWMHAGCDELDFAMLKQKGVKVGNNRGVNGPAVAEHAVALLLAVAKKLIVMHRKVREARWFPQWLPENQGVALEGKTLVVIGLGQIGTAIAKRMRAFNAKVIGIRRHPEKGGEHVDAVYGPKDLVKALRQANFAIVAAPLTKETHGLIGAPEVKAMKKGAILVNIARGNLVQEYPVYQGLKSGHLGGYGADVWWSYVDQTPSTYHFPVASRTNLQYLPNVVGTPDQGARVIEVLRGHVDWAIENANAFLRGKPMPRAVNLDLGY